MTAIPTPISNNAGSFASAALNAEGAVVPDPLTYASDIDASIGAVNSDGSATFTGAFGSFSVTATDASGLSASDTFELADLVPATITPPTFTAG
jgi:hypothetical protein